MNPDSAPDVRAVDIGGLLTTVRSAGSGPPLLYLHDQFTAGRWTEFHESLCQRFTVFAPDHPGFAQTPMPDGLDGFEDLVLHYDTLLDHLGLARVHVVGASLGGWIAAELAVFLPRRFASLALIAPMGLRVPGMPTADQFRWTPRERAAALFGDVETLERAWLEDAGAEVGTAVQSYSDSIAFARLAWNPRYDAKLDTRLWRVTAPTTVLIGEDDVVVSAAHAKRYAALIRNAKLTVITGSDGHCAPHLIGLAQPNRTAELVGAAVRDASSVAVPS